MVQLSMDSTFHDILLNSITDSDTSMLFDNLNWNNCYYWRVRAFDGYEYGDWSSISSFSTITEQITPGNDEYKVPLNIVLEWNQTDNVDFYELKISDDAAMINNCKIFSNLEICKLDMKNLSNNTSYYWSIRSQNSGKFTQWSEPFKFTTQLTTPVALTPKDITHPSPEIIPLTFSWTPTEDKELYHLQISNDSNFNNIIFDNNTIESEQFILNEKLSENTYYWRVSALNSKNSSDWSETKTFNISATVDVNSNETENEIYVYPNPFNSETSFNISISNPEPVQLKIYSIEGKEIEVVVNEFLQAGKYQYKLNSSLFNSGIYYYVLSTGQNIKSGKLIIAK